MKRMVVHVFMQHLSTKALGAEDIVWQRLCVNWGWRDAQVVCIGLMLVTMYSFKRHDNEKLGMAAPCKMNQLWVGDVTFLKTGTGWQYLAVVMDMYSRRIIGWALANHRKASLTCEALKMAIAVRQPEAGLWFHSDRGIEYAALEYQAVLMQYGINQA